MKPEPAPVRLLRMHSWLMTLIGQLERVADEMWELTGQKGRPIGGEDLFDDDDHASK